MLAPLAEPEANIEPQLLPNGDMVTVMTVKDTMCKWPIGDPAESTFGFCGRAWEIEHEASMSPGDQHEIDVSGDNWSQVETWATEHPTAWVSDPLGKIRYDAHQYFDADHTERYVFGYDAELAKAATP